jgi:hypothetical protein
VADLTSGLAHVISLVHFDVNCECCYHGYYYGACSVLLLLCYFFFFGFSLLIQGPLSCSPTAAFNFASIGQQGAARRGEFLCAWPLAREVWLWRT